MFVCDACKSAALVITRTLEVVPEDDSDEQSVQILTCHNCAEPYVAVYEESRRGSLDRESSHHDAWKVSEDDLRAVVRAIEACPSPQSRTCKCATHAAFNNGGFRERLSGAWFRLRRA